MSQWAGALMKSVASQVGLSSKVLALLNWAIEAGVVGLGAGCGFLVFLALVLMFKVHKQGDASFPDDAQGREQGV